MVSRSSQMELNHRFLEPLKIKKKKYISPPFKGMGAVLLEKDKRNA